MIENILEITGSVLPKLLIALPILGLANIIGGALLGEIEHEFSKAKLLEGVKKLASVYFMILLIVGAGVIVNIQLFTINGSAMTLIEATTLGVFAAVGLYGVKAVIKLYEILQVNIKVEGK